MSDDGTSYFPDTFKLEVFYNKIKILEEENKRLNELLRKMSIITGDFIKNINNLIDETIAKNGK